MNFYKNIYYNIFINVFNSRKSSTGNCNINREIKNSTIMVINHFTKKKRKKEEGICYNKNFLLFL